MLSQSHRRRQVISTLQQRSTDACTTMVIPMTALTTTAKMTVHPQQLQQDVLQTITRIRRPRRSCDMVIVWLLGYLFTLAAVRPAHALWDSRLGYNASTDVTNILNFAYDIRDMRDAKNNLTLVKSIYINGSNALPQTLAGLSLNSQSHYAQTLFYNLYRWAFDDIGIKKEGDIDSQFDGSPIEQYAHTLVMDLFTLNITGIEAEGALVYNILMAYWSTLFQLRQTCRDQQLSNVTDTQQAQTELLQYLDTAAAFWIGAGQEAGDATTGYVFYSLSESLEESYYVHDEGMTINQKVIGTFQQIKAKISSNACATGGDEVYQQMTTYVRKLIGWSNVIIVRMLLRRVTEAVDDASKSDHVELYSLAILPQIMACNMSNFDLLFQYSVLNDVAGSTQSQIIAAIQQSYPCLFITCADVGKFQDSAIPQCDDGTATTPGPTMAGYQPLSNVRAKAAIDRDLKLIDIMMRFHATSTAEHLYTYGWSTDFSLRKLAINDFSGSTSTEFDIFKTYSRRNDYLYADALVQQILDRSDPLQGINNDQQAHMLHAILQAIVMYLAATAELDAAVSACHDGKPSETIYQYWDGAVAFIVGSMEGPLVGGQDGGASILALAKQMCQSFGKCEPKDTVFGQQLVTALKLGLQKLQANQCAAVETLSTQNIKPALLIPLFQAVIYYTDSVEETTDSSSLHDADYLFAYTKAIVPAIYVIDQAEAAAIVQDGSYLLTGQRATTLQAYATIRDAMAYLEHQICLDIGKIVTNGVLYGFCPGDDPIPVNIVPTPAPFSQVPTVIKTLFPSDVVQPGDWTAPPVPEFNVSDQSKGLAWGRFVFSNQTVAENDSNFALDVRDMYNSDTPDIASDIYNNASTHALGGMSGSIRLDSLADLSTKAAAFMANDPMFNYYRLALFKDSSFDSTATANASAWAYADEVVQLAFSNGRSAQLASEATVVMNIWMFIVHRLYEGLGLCKTGTSHPEVIDSAVALWIGQEQAEGKYDRGWMLYSIAQRAEQGYGHAEREAVVNTNLMNFFIDAQQYSTSCATDNEEQYMRYRILVNKIIRELSKPLLQRLLQFISEDDYDNIELYSLAFIPQTISCDENAYEYLRDTLFENFERDNSFDNELVSNLAKALNCMRLTCADLGDVTNATDQLKHVVGALCDELDNGYNGTMIAGFQTNGHNAIELARLDLDIHQINLLLRANANHGARDYYELGWNSIGPNGTISLLSIATSDDRNDMGDLFQLYQSYFVTPNYADDIIQNALNKDGQYDGASRWQRAEGVTRALQTMVSYMEVIRRLFLALDACSKKEGGQSDVDNAVAMFVGSIEGPFSGGDMNSGGMMMFGLAKEFCGAFDKCIGNGNAEINEAIMYGFEDIKEALDAGDCDTAIGKVTESVIGNMPVPLIQGTLALVSENESMDAQATNGTLAAVDVIAKAVLPLVYDVNQAVAATIADNTEFNSSLPPVRNGSQTVFTAFGQVMRAIGVDCNDVGTYMKLISTCAAEIAPEPDTPTNLGNNLYVTTTYVQDRADIALDISEMESDLRGGNEKIAQIIYENGANSAIYDDRGMKLSVRSLGGFSVNASQTMKINPLFQIAVYALADENQQYLGSPATQFANTIVLEAFQKVAGSKNTMPADAAVALNLWMEIANELYQTVDNCKNNKIADMDGVHSIDEAVAYWIGDGQIAGSSERGHLLYALAEQMGEQFGLDDSGQSRTNTNILNYFQLAKNELSLPNACSEGSMTARHIRYIVDHIASQMMIVNIQALISTLRVGERARVRIYAHGVVPFVAACSPSTFAYLKSHLIDSDYNEIDIDNIVAAIRSTFTCFGISCNDVGIHTTEDATVCSDPGPLTRLAGYRPANDVREFAQLDFDILELEILMRMGAYDAALELYEFGKHATTNAIDERTALSLQFLGTTSGRTVVPEFDAYKRYYGGNEAYADNIVMHAMNDTSLSAVERRVQVVSTCQYDIMYMATMQGLYESINSCQTGTVQTGSTGADSWDKAAAFMIGRMEGDSESGSDEGRLIWALSKKTCTSFDTCSNEVEGSSHVNDKIVTLLYAGRGALLGGNCDSLRKTAKEIAPLLLIPLIQASLIAAIQLRDQVKVDNIEELQVQARMYAEALLPLVDNADRDASATIKNKYAAGQKMSDSSVSAIAASYSKTMSKLGINCDDIGESDDVDPCTGTVKKKKTGMITGIVLGVVVLAAAAYLLRSRRRKRLAKEETAVFLPSKGVLNHTSDVPMMAPPESARRNGVETAEFLKSNADAALDDDDDGDVVDEDDTYMKEFAKSKANGFDKHKDDYDNDNHDHEQGHGEDDDEYDRSTRSDNSRRSSDRSRSQRSDDDYQDNHDGSESLEVV